MKQNKIVEAIQQLLTQKEHILVAIDGRCGSGKTTLSSALQEQFSCPVIHMDHFFLRPEQRTKQRLDAVGENVDHERFLSEVLYPLSKAKPAEYKPFVCSTQDFGETITVVPEKLVIVEGSYSCHPTLWDYYDLHIFSDIDSKTQAERIIKRNGVEAAEVFKNKWIPLEEKYFEKYKIKENCDIVI